MRRWTSAERLALATLQVYNASLLPFNNCAALQTLAGEVGTGPGRKLPTNEAIELGFG